MKYISSLVLVKLKPFKLLSFCLSYYRKRCQSFPNVFSLIAHDSGNRGEHYVSRNMKQFIGYHRSWECPHQKISHSYIWVQILWFSSKFELILCQSNWRTPQVTRHAHTKYQHQIVLYDLQVLAIYKGGHIYTAIAAFLDLREPARTELRHWGTALLTFFSNMQESCVSLY